MTILSEVARPALRWHGGKWRLAPWIIGYFPEHRVYVEPFGGAASVLLRKQRSYGEVYNDLDTEVVGLFRVLRDAAKSARLIEQLRLTPFSREEFQGSYQPHNDDVEAARRLVVRSFMGFGSNAHVANATGFRANSNRSGTTPAHDQKNYAEVLPVLIDRFSSVVVECKDAFDVMSQHDGLDTLHYLDPPYHPDTRDDGRDYRHEMDADGHANFLDFVVGLKGSVVISGYQHPTYDDALSDWFRVEKEAMADGARKRTEVLWINKTARERHMRSAPLFANLEAAE